MKKVILILLTAVVAVSTIAFAQNSAEPEQQKSSGQVIVYYFHGNFRCATCFNMEKYSKEAIENKIKSLIG